MPPAWRSSARNTQAPPTATAAKATKTVEGQSAQAAEASKAAASKGGGKAAKPRAKAKALGLPERVSKLESRMDLTTKGTLGNSDAIREIQGALGYGWAYAETTHPIFQAMIEEGVEYHKDSEV